MRIDPEAFAEDMGWRPGLDVGERFAREMGWRERYGRDLFGREIGGYGGGTIQWDEKDHPRDEDGKFVEKGGGKAPRPRPKVTIKFPTAVRTIKEGLPRGLRNLLYRLDKETGEWIRVGKDGKREKMTVDELVYLRRHKMLEDVETEDKEVDARPLMIRAPSGEVYTYNEYKGGYFSKDGSPANLGDLEKHIADGKYEVLQWEGEDEPEPDPEPEDESKKAETQETHPLRATIDGKSYLFDRTTGEWYDQKNRWGKVDQGRIQKAIERGEAKIEETYQGNKDAPETETVETVTIKSRHPDRRMRRYDGLYRKDKESGNWYRVGKPMGFRDISSFESNPYFTISRGTEEIQKIRQPKDSGAGRKYRSFSSLAKHLSSDEWKSKVAKAVEDFGKPNASGNWYQEFRNQFKPEKFAPLTIRPTMETKFRDTGAADKALDFFESNAAYRYLPVTIKKTTSKRASADKWSISVRTVDSAATYAHEIGHLFENDDGVAKAANEFLQKRVKDRNLSLVRLKDITGLNYDPSEVAYVRRKEGGGWIGVSDKESLSKGSSSNWAYCGKQYPKSMANRSGHTSTEIVSVGIEHYYLDPVSFAKNDPEYFGFIVSVLNGEI